jgi:hypothetical protein
LPSNCRGRPSRDSRVLAVSAARANCQSLLHLQSDPTKESHETQRSLRLKTQIAP